MPKTKISEFSATPGNNTDIDGINISEGCAPSGINDAIRELMAQLKDFQAGTAGDSFNGPVGTTTPAAGVFTNLSASGTFALTGDQVQISEGGTGQTTANAAFNALAPSQTSQAGKYLKTDGTNTSWDAIDINTADITGTLPIANGGTGLTALGTGVQTALGQNVTGSGGIVLASSPSLTTPNLGTPSAVTLTNATGLPLSTGVTGTLATTNGGTGLTSFTANGVVYASSSSALTTGSALTFDGTYFTVGASATTGDYKAFIQKAGGELLGLNASSGTLTRIAFGNANASFGSTQIIANAADLAFITNSAEQMRLTSTGLGIGTSSPAAKLDVQGSATDFVAFNGLNTNNNAGVATSSAIKFGFTSTVGTHYATLKITEDAGNDNSGGLTISLPFGGVESTKLTLNSSGNLGLGVTPSAWYTGFKSFQAGATTALADFSSGTYLFNNWYIAASGANTYLTSNFASSYSQVSGEHRFYNAPSGTAGNAISFTQAMTLDASGNLGIGVTPSAWYSDRKVAQIGSGAGFQGSASVKSFLELGANIYANSSGNDIYIGTDYASKYRQYQGAHQWYTAPSGTAGNAISFTQAMTLDASGRLLIGGTSTYDFNGQANLVVNGTANNATITIASTDTGYLAFADGTSGTDRYTGSIQYLHSSNAMLFSTNGGVERARITSGGDLLVGVTAFPNSTTSGLGYSPSSSYLSLSCGSTTTSVNQVYFTNGNGTVGSISTSGTATAYNTSSDYRLKNNPQPLTGSGAFIDALKPKIWNWKTDGSKGVGFIAHEVQEVSPGSVVGTKDAVDEEGKPIMQAMEYGSAEFIANIIAELQSLRARVAQLEAK